MSPVSERVTRKKKIDPLLRKSGWDIQPYTDSTPLSSYHAVALEEFPTNNGPADYALILNGKIVGVIEAKRESVGPQEVLTQARRYAKGIPDSIASFSCDEYRIPFLYSSNGTIIWFIDVRNEQNRSHEIKRFHTPQALQERLSSDFDTICQKLISTPNTHPRLRPYQIQANQAVETAITERKQKMLVAMATGTGKTFTMVNQVYRLMKSGVAKRVLFLVDRRALAAQAIRAFASFEPEPGLKFDKIYEVYSQSISLSDGEDGEKVDFKKIPESYLTDPKPDHAYVYVCTIQRLTINLFGRSFACSGSNVSDEGFDEDAAELSIPIHAFDMIIADECHRGYTSSEEAVWRQTLSHFDSTTIGLTATPASHTIGFFKEKVFEYKYEDAVRDGYLVDWDLVKVRSNVRIEGIFLKEDDEIESIDAETGDFFTDHLEDERAFDASEIEQKITAIDSNRKILKEIKKYADDHQKVYGRFPKTLIFAVNDLPHTSHADQLVDLARDIFKKGDEFVQKITGKVDRPLQHIREFRNRQKPGVVVTVDLLTTGVDIPDLEYIVFLRPVKSRILFEQMIGRGTRKGEHYDNKSQFWVFDCFDGTLVEYFKKSCGVAEMLPRGPVRPLEEIIKDIWDNKDRQYNTRVLVKRLHRIDKEMSGDARVLFSRFIPDGDVAKFAIKLEGKLKDDFTGTMEILKNKDFTDLCTSYPRKKRFFYRDYITEDTVTSELVIRDSGGNDYKPEDYLTAFSRFVRENPEKVDAITILLERPRDFRHEVLDTLRTILKQQPQHFTEVNLQRAFQAKYRKSLVDIISMVKRAAREESPLLTADERVMQAFVRVCEGKTFSPEQQEWLDRIRMHLVENLSIAADDFDDMPVFADRGGFGRANRIFDGGLSQMITDFNLAICAEG